MQVAVGRFQFAVRKSKLPQFQFDLWTAAKYSREQPIAVSISELHWRYRRAGSTPDCINIEEKGYKCCTRKTAPFPLFNTEKRRFIYVRNGANYGKKLIGGIIIIDQNNRAYFDFHKIIIISNLHG